MTSGSRAGRVALRAVLVTLLVVTAGTAASLWTWCRRNLLFAGAVPIFITVEYESVYFDPRRPLPEPITMEKLWGDRNSPQREHLRQQTRQVLAGASTDFDRARVLCEWTRAQCRQFSADLEQVGDAQAILEGLRAGKGALCGPLARLLREALVANGIPARMVMFMREPPFPSDGHAVVEAFVDGHWVLFDPTFNVHWRVNGEPVSVWQLREAYYYRPWGRVEMVEGHLPLTRTLHNYHVAYAPQLNAVIYEYYENPLARRYGLIRYPFLKLLQSNFVHLVHRDATHTTKTAALRINNILVWLIYVWLPGAFLACAIALLATFIERPRRSSAG
jgi:hypothetical protein